MNRSMFTQGVTSSGLLTDATKQLTVIPGGLYHVYVDPPTSGVADIAIYDSATGGSAAADLLFRAEISAGTNAGNSLNVPVTVNKGLYVVFTTATGSSGYLIHYTIG